MKTIFTRYRVLGFAVQLCREEVISSDQLRAFVQQLQLEGSFGLEHMLYMRMRDWIEYLLKANGIEYPSVQPVTDAIYALAGVTPPHMMHATYKPLAQLGRKLVQLHTPETHYKTNFSAVE